MKILVTGTAGFIGFHLSKSLLEDGYEVLGIDNVNNYYDPNLKLARLDILNKYSTFKFEKIDIANRELLTKSFTDFKPAKVVNLAAQAGVRYSLTNPYAYMESNLVGFLNVIELCRHNAVEGLIYASSSSVYGSNDKMPFSTAQKTDNPLSLYAATKKSNELMAHAYSHLFGIRTTGLRFFTVYGPWGRPDMAMYIFAEKILKGEPLKVFNYGKMKRDFTFIDDIVAGIRSSMEKNYQFEVFNLGNNTSESITDVINLIEKEFGREANMDLHPIQPGDVPETRAEISSSQQKLGYNPKISIQQGIPAFITWYKEYHAV